MVVLSYRGNTQTLRSDSTKIPNSHLEKVLRAAKIGNIYKEEVKSKQREITILYNRIDNKDSIINDMNRQTQINREITDKYLGNYNMEKSKNIDLQNSFDNYRKQSDKQIKSLRRQNTFKYIKGVLIGAAAGILTGILVK